MSKLKLNKINFDESDFLVEVVKEKKEKNNKNEPSQVDLEAQKKIQNAYIEIQKKLDEAELVLNRAKDEAQNLVESARAKAKEISDNSESDALKRKEEIIEEAIKRADEIVETAKNSSEKEANELIEKSKEEIEQERVTTIKTAYDEGYKDGLEHIQDELKDKLADFDKFFASQYELRDKILKSANKDILDLVLNIVRKVLLKETEAQTLEKIIKTAISLLEKKENVNILLSEKYARILYEHQKESLNSEIEFNFEDFKQFENFDVVYSPEFDDDTIIVENLKERFDASIASQLDVIIRNIYDNSQNGKLDLEQYIQDETE